MEAEIQALEGSVEKEMKEASSSAKITMKKMVRTKAVRRALYAGMGLQIFQQFVGINTVMYYSPTIIQLAGFASNTTALLLSLVTAGLNAFGSILSIYFIDKIGRKNLVLISIVGVALSHVVLFGTFFQSETHSPMVSPIQTSYFNGTCPAYASAMDRGAWDCMRCLKSSPHCGFCAHQSDKVTTVTILHLISLTHIDMKNHQLFLILQLSPGACLIMGDTSKNLCQTQHRSYYTEGCPSKYGYFAVMGLALYILFFSPGMGTVPWVVNSEIYPLRYRGICGGIASTAVWVSNLIVSQTFLSLTKAIGTSWTFLIFGFIAVLAFFFTIIFVPETRGVPIEEVEMMLEQRALHFRFWKREKDAKEDNGRDLARSSV